MSEPDEAMRYARLRAKGRMSSPNNPHRTIERRVEVDAGKHDDELADEAQAYRAGQAASAERIKALKEALSAWVEKECDYMRRNNLGNPEVQPAVIWSRALLKEADQ
jgi:hypothetical protein